MNNWLYSQVEGMIVDLCKWYEAGHIFFSSSFFIQSFRFYFMSCYVSGDYDVVLFLLYISSQTEVVDYLSL